MNYCICQYCNLLFSILTTCSYHLYNDIKGSGASPDFVASTAVDSMLCVSSGGVLYTAGECANVDASKENSIFSRGM